MILDKENNHWQEYGQQTLQSQDADWKPFVQIAFWGFSFTFKSGHPEQINMFTSSCGLARKWLVQLYPDGSPEVENLNLWIFASTEIVGTIVIQALQKAYQCIQCCSAIWGTLFSMLSYVKYTSNSVFSWILKHNEIDSAGKKKKCIFWYARVPQVSIIDPILRCHLENKDHQKTKQ